MVALTLDGHTRVDLDTRTLTRVILSFHYIQVSQFSLCNSKAEKTAMKERLKELEEDQRKEKNESVPWKSLLKYLQALVNDVETGEIGRQVEMPSNKDKRLHRTFEDLRNKINDEMQRNEDEKRAKERQLEKVQHL